MEHGIKVKPTPITAGEKVEVEYDGLLAKSGADQVYLHAGFGHHKNWDNVQDIKMENRNGVWRANIEVNTDDRFNFCFHDSAYNWDNNNGFNWSFEVHNGNLY